MMCDPLQDIGTIHFTVRFMPFDDPKFDDDIELTPLKTGKARGFGKGGEIGPV